MSRELSYLNEIGLRGYRVISVDEQRDLTTLHLQTRFDERAQGCPYCQAEGTEASRSEDAGRRLYSKGPYRRKVKHLRAFGRPVFLQIHTRRYQCRDCSRSFIPELRGIQRYRHSTEPFRRRVYQMQRDGVSVKASADRNGLGSATVERIYHEHTERKVRERSNRPCPAILGIDEHFIRSQRAGKRHGRKFATTLCNLKTHRVFDIVEGRSPAELAHYFSRLSGRERVRVVCIDLSSSYRSLIRRYFPNARIVADRFHVVRIIQQQFMDLFRQFAPEIKHHRGYLAALRTSPARLSDYRRSLLLKLFEAHPEVEAVYRQMRKTIDLINLKTAKARKAKSYIRELLLIMKELKNSGFAAMKSLARTLEQWIEPIACMWRFRKTNGITEGFHRKMKLIQRRAYGFRNFENYRLRVIAECG